MMDGFDNPASQKWRYSDNSISLIAFSINVNADDSTVGIEV